MTPKYLKIAVLAAAATIAGGCAKVELTPVNIAPLYSLFEHYDSMPEARRDSILHVDSLAISAMMSYMGHDTVSDSTLSDWANSAAVRIFTPAVDSVYPSLRPLGEEFAIILANAAKEGFSLPKRQYAATVWGMSKSMVLTDSVMLIALNHYLGADYPGYHGWPEYMRTVKTPKRLPYDFTEALLANAYPYRQGAESTVLSRLVYEGALVMAKIKLVPEGNLAEALGYDRRQMEWLSSHSSEIWNTLVRGNMLYSTSTDIADRLTTPSAVTAILSPEAPGRAGRYIGYQIVLSFMENNATTPLPSLLQPEFYANPSLLIESAYSGG